MNTPGWYFTPRRPNSKARNSDSYKFFRSDAVEDMADSIVREGIQNSLDADCSDDLQDRKRVSVRISFGECAWDDAAEFFPGLFEHLQAMGEKIPNPPRPGEPVKYLSFEDFETTGLKGDPREWDPKDDRNAFFNFFRAEGITSKEGNQRGRHGVGKTVFSSASRANSILGLTYTEEQGSLLMGSSTLAVHKLDQISFDPDGWFGNEERIENDPFVVPVVDHNVLKRFANSFRLRRGRNSGLSIVVPWVNDSIEPEKVVIAVVRGFFWPILANRLQVRVEFFDGTFKLITDNCFGELIDEISSRNPSFSNDLKATVELAQWAQNQRTETIPIAGSPKPGGIPSWESGLLPEDIREKLRESLSEGDPIALRLQVRVGRKKAKRSEASVESFDIFLKQDPTCPSGSIRFVRDGLMIPGVKSRPYPNHRALVIVENRAGSSLLAQFLGDAENPSHTEWQEPYVHDKYLYPKDTLRYVTQSVPNLLKTLYEQKKEGDRTLWLDMFGLPETKEPAPKRKAPAKSARDGTSSEPAKLEVKPKRARRFSLQKIINGFAIGSPADGVEPPKTIDVQIAYDSRRGNPFKKYQKEDFDLSSKSIRIESEGAEIKSKSGNRLVVEILNGKFRIEVSGFDPNRDLRIEARADSENQESEDAEDV
jgi:hypothetical protein